MLPTGTSLAPWAGPDVGAGLVALLVTGGLAVVLCRQRSYATARSLLGVAIVGFVGSLLHVLLTTPAVTVETVARGGSGATDSSWLLAGGATTIVTGGLWVLFAVQYTGRGRRLFRGAVAGVALLSVTAVVLAALAVLTPSDGILVGGLVLLFVVTGLLVVAGVYVLLWASIGQNAFPLEEPLLLSAGALALFSGVHVARVFEYSAVYPASLALAGLFVLVAVRYYPVFETVPAARVAGRDRVIDEMAAGVLVLDRDGVVRDANPAAARHFGVDRETVLGRPAGALSDPPIDPAAVVAPGEPRRVETATGARLAVTGTRVTDAHSRRFGTVVLCEDVTDRQLRADQLTLHGRCVGDTVRDAMAAVAADAATIRDEQTVTADTVADRAWQTATALTRLVANARAIEQAIEATGDGADTCPDLRAVVREAIRQAEVDDVATDEPTLPSEPVGVAVPPALATVVVTQILSACARHAHHRVSVELHDEDEPTVRVCADDSAAPDRPDGDRALDRTLAATRTAVEQAGGTLGRRDAAGGGDCIAVAFPAVHAETAVSDTGTPAGAPGADLPVDGREQPSRQRPDPDGRSP